MEKKVFWTKDKIMRLSCVAVGELFCLATMVYRCIDYRGISQVLICLLSALCLIVPEMVERLLKIQIPTPIYLFALVYSLGPTLGHAYTFYAIIPWWDTLLHATGGVVFALFGAYLPCLFQKDGKCNLLICALFGLFFSVTVSVVWEFIEYFCDCFFVMDMQQDTVISGFNSYVLGSLDERIVGQSGTITETIIHGSNGTFAVQGYIDTGSLDTMEDMIFETFGAVVYTVVFLLDRGKHVGLAMPKKAE